MPYKFGSRQGDGFAPHIYPQAFARERVIGPQGPRLRIAAPEGHGDLMLALTRELNGPFAMLVVLHTPRVEAPGRYQSPWLTLDELDDFVEEFQPFLEGDGRHDFWIHSGQGDGTLVYDRHNVIYAYGPLAAFERVLQARGFATGEVTIPVPHEHRYHPQFDVAERRLIASFRWVRSALLRVDEQLQD